MRKKIRDFLQLESASGIILFAAALIAMLWANSPFYSYYLYFTNTGLFIINEGLMAVFFLLVGLELKRGLVEDQFLLSDVMLPLLAAFGGMVVPALIYLFINAGRPETMMGWATPVATDIAFALGVLSLFGSRIKSSLKLFLLSIAIFDDIGAILIIAFFHSHALAWIYLFYAMLVVIMMVIANNMKVRSLYMYLLAGLLLWALFLKAGIHPTIAGVITAFLLPQHPQFELKLHPWVAFGIMPLFALANAGLSLQDVSLSMLFDTVTMGVVLGLFFGKQAGVLGASWLSMKCLRFVALPTGARWSEIYGIALLCGIGFTMSLFLGTLSFQGHSHYINQVRLGVMIGSILSGITGALILALVIKRKPIVLQS